MIDLIKAFLNNPESKNVKNTNGPDGIVPAATALLVEAAAMDGHFHGAERLTIQRLLAKYFSLSPEGVKEIIDTVQNNTNGPNNVFSASQVINKALDYEERISIMEMIWEVILADGRIDDFEANLARRIAGLIHVKDQDSGAAKKRVLSRVNA